MEREFLFHNDRGKSLVGATQVPLDVDKSECINGYVGRPRPFKVLERPSESEEKTAPSGKTKSPRSSLGLGRDQEGSSTSSTADATEGSISTVTPGGEKVRTLLSPTRESERDDQAEDDGEDDFEGDVASGEPKYGHYEGDPLSYPTKPCTAEYASQVYRR